MRVVLLTQRATINSAQDIGDVIEVDDREAHALIASRQAHIETAMDEPRIEKAVTRKGRGR